MKTILGKVFLVVSIFFSNLVVGEDLEDVITYGELLTEAVQNKKLIKLKKLNQYKEIKKYLSDNKCPGYKYKAYIVNHEKDERLYLVASKGKNVIIGRHFRADVSNNDVDLSTFQSSTNGCLNLGPVKPNAAGMYATHLKPLPNEFHLLQSSIRSIALYIGTKNGMYVVKDGKFLLSKKEE